MDEPLHGQGGGGVQVLALSGLGGEHGVMGEAQTGVESAAAPVTMGRGLDKVKFT